MRATAEWPLRQGVLESPWHRLIDGVVLGTAVFAANLRQQARGNPREQQPLRPPVTAATWEGIVAALEQVKGERWSDFADRHGDWGRDAALWLGRSAGRLRLADLGKRVGNLDYAVVSKAIARFEERLRRAPDLREQMAAVRRHLTNAK